MKEENMINRFRIIGAKDFSVKLKQGIKEFRTRLSRCCGNTVLVRAGIFLFGYKNLSVGQMKGNSYIIIK